MSMLRDNPVIRHAGRLANGRRWPLAVLVLLAGAAVLGLGLQKYWMELELYSLLRPRAAGRWLGLTLMAESVVALPWAAVRGALLWRRLWDDGHLDEYRRTRLPAAQITLGMAAAVVKPVLWLLALSLLLSLGVAAATGGLEPGEVLAAHAVLAAMTLAFCALGLWLAARVRYAGLAIPLALAVLAAAILAIRALDPLYRAVGSPERWIFAALLPNPLTAVGSALGTDVLRFSWVYQQVRAHEYFFVYPSAWQTAGFYGAAAAVLLSLVGRRVAWTE